MSRIIVDVTTGAQSVDDDFVAPSPPVATPADLRNAKAAITAFADRIAATITGPVPETERASWPTKETAARAWLANASAPHQTAMLQAEADLTGETLAALAAKVVANADAYITIAGTLTGFRRTYMAQLDALPPDAPIVAVEGIVAAARSHADAILDQLI